MTPLLPKRFPVRQGGRVGRGKPTLRESIEDALRYAAASLFGLFGLFVVYSISGYVIWAWEHLSGRRFS